MAVSASYLPCSLMRRSPPMACEVSPVTASHVPCPCRTSGDISPDVLSFNTVLRMLSGAGNAHASLALLQCMASCGVYPRVSTYSIALASAAVAGDAAVVIEVWRSMSSLHVVPNIDCVNILLGTLVQQVRPSTPSPSPTTSVRGAFGCSEYTFTLFTLQPTPRSAVCQTHIGSCCDCSSP